MKRAFEISTDIYPFESKWLDIDGITIHYLDEGEGPTLLLCHGNPTWSLLYVPIIRLLKDKFRCVAIDYPGFGFSGKPDISDYGYTPAEHSNILIKAIDKLGLDQFSIFVQDWGGPIGLNAATEYADRIENMFIGNTWAWAFEPGTPMGEASEKFSSKMGGDAMKEKIMQKNSFLNISMPLLVRGARRHMPELRNQIKQAYLAPFSTPESRIPTWIFPRQIMAAKEFLSELNNKFEQRLSEKPTILFWGEKDLVFPPHLIPEWEKRLKNFKKVLFPEASHFFQEEEPEQISTEIKQFAL